MKTLTITALTLSLFAGSALAADSRGEIDSDVLYGGAHVTPTMGAPAMPGYAVRGEISHDLLYGGISVRTSPATPLGERMVTRGEIDTDLLYGS